MIEGIKSLLGGRKARLQCTQDQRVDVDLKSMNSSYGKLLNLTKSEKEMLVKMLTQRERDTYLLLLEGLTLKEAAEKLGISYSTTNTHQAAVYKKLSVSSKAELIINYRDIQ